jgi:GNAT superfamily N-acetyltransferase
MPIRYQFDCHNVTTPELEHIFAATDLGGRQGERILRAFQNSAHVCLAFDGDRLIGTSRAISDGEYHGFIYDVAVLPEYQGRGLGRHMVEALIERMPVWRIMLRADDDVQAFYGKMGFALYEDVMARVDSDFFLADAAKGSPDSR